MNRRIASTVAVVAGLALTAGAGAGPAAAEPAGTTTAAYADQRTAEAATRRPDDRTDHLEERRRALRERASELVARGKAAVQRRGSSRSVRVAPGQWVEHGVQDTSQLLSFLVEFGDQTDPRFPDAPAGPLHNEIPEPTKLDNSSYWVEDFDREHYRDMLFDGLRAQRGESMRDLYREMSSGRFDLRGDVSDWVQVPFHEASYGTTETLEDLTRYIGDTATAWYDAQVAAGRTPAQIRTYLERFDAWDRYDHDGDGVFAEPDGYVDHFQAIHAGPGEESGAPPWTIGSHRSAANPTGTDGPEAAPFGGVQIGETGIWIREYTTEPENGALGVFAHEFGHDLGLADYYDTLGAENGTGFWNLMSHGSWLNHGTDTIGTTPSHLGAHEKLQLGWLDHTVVAAGDSATVDLGPAFHATKKSQAVLVELPPGTEQTDVGPAASGRRQLYSGAGDNRTATVTSPAFTVPSGGELTARASYEIEAGYDWAYVEVSADDGATWTALETDRSEPGDPRHGITGSTDGAWVGLTADLAAYAGRSVRVRFRTVTDQALHLLGLRVDDIAVTGDPGTVLATGVEDGAPQWTRDGFVVVTDGQHETTYSHYYLAENRVYGGYDVALREGPLHFPYWTPEKYNTVQRFPYQDGLLVWYVNGRYADNNTSQHPGGGAALPVDAMPQPLTWSDGRVARNRIQTSDATFGLGLTTPWTLTEQGWPDGTSTLRARTRLQQAVFDDSDPERYWDPANPTHSTLVAGSGTRIRVLSRNPVHGTMRVRVN
ncbi:immune inhibitor A domain-containing protein [Nocardioides pantholopis]|uniref:immune inhibitor A domain-containing protein n=1 Tax=Nocardioides pantholopis TaxID=2483798 RepID=UPI000FD75BA5|nr:immune inhibitor A domain-containing protein [Nocardioides pantholopis]